MSQQKQPMTDEIYQLKKALLQTQIQLHQTGFALAQMQLKELEREKEAAVADHSENGKGATVE